MWDTHEKIETEDNVNSGLDKDSHDISIVFRAPQQLVGTQVFYNAIPLQCDHDVDIM